MADVEHPAGPNGDLSQKENDKSMDEPAPALDPAPHVPEAATPTTDAPSSTPVPLAPPSLTDNELATLSAIASGDEPDTYPLWEENLKPLVLKQLAHNVYRFLTDAPPHPPPRPEIPSTTFGLVFKKFPVRGPPSPRSTTVRLPVLLNGEELKKQEDKIKEMLDEFDEEAPFTMQRLAELLLYPFREYRMVGKYLRAIERVLSVTPSFDPQIYAPIAPAAAQPGTSASGPNIPSTPFQLASTPLFSPIPFLHGKELPIPPPRRSASPPMSPLDIGPRRSPNTSPRGSPRIAARRGGPRVATSSAAMSAQTRRRANSQSSPTSPVPLMLGSTSRPGMPSLPDAFPVSNSAPPSAASSSGSQRRSPTPPPKSPPTGPTPTRVDELDNPDAHKTMLDEPVALSSVTTGKVKIRSPELRPADLPSILAVVASAESGTEPVAGLGLSLGERFVSATSSAADKNADEPKNDEGNGSNGSNGSGEGDEGEVERMVSEEREMEDVPEELEREALGNWEVVDKPTETTEDVQMGDD
ncbi:hypothetical protein CALVIDRAFT_595891 [Calocera viscosa TUFC12733]|uniref:PPP4R2-domain-containing protein n=1 Tax=Calocera viscosa (strain TUFC12733) TaxID=1330018 RepID=A0A167QJ88_CALVF|nr:hypothetical protein CALVIDRAFT_595891 [Calocera viscosa TUFC12733]